MKLFTKFSIGMALASAISIAQADDAISYSVLKQLPLPYPSVTPWSATINTQEEWQQFYASLKDIDLNPQITAPKIDFEQYQLIAGGFGSRGTGGFSVVVNRVDEVDNVIYISVLDIGPSPGCLLEQAVTYPSTAILIKKTNKPLKFSVIKLTAECTD